MKALSLLGTKKITPRADLHISRNSPILRRFARRCGGLWDQSQLLEGKRGREPLFGRSGLGFSPAFPRFVQWRLVCRGEQALMVLLRYCVPFRVRL